MLHIDRAGGKPRVQVQALDTATMIWFSIIRRPPEIITDF
jgi:hypothetical protein